MKNITLSHPNFKDDEQLANVFTPVKFKHLKSGNIVEAEDEAELAMYEKDAKYERVVESPRSSRGAARARKRDISYDEAVALADRNLAESLGCPSALIEQGYGFEFSATVTKHIGQISRVTSADFPSTQVKANVNGKDVLFCILFNPMDKPGTVLDLVTAEPGEGVTVRSNMVIERQKAQ